MISHPPIFLGVNIDHVATLRQARHTPYPSVLYAALAAEQAGADSITAHLREDRRHIQDADIDHLKHLIETRLNLEMAITDDMIATACRVKPWACCLVPERREELTTEGGLNVALQKEKTRAACVQLGEAGIEVSLFIDADHHQIDAAAECGAHVIELHTGHYAEAQTSTARHLELERIRQAAYHAHAMGLKVNAGHGLNYHNVTDIAAIPRLVELNIGHAIVARALFTGLIPAVTEMKRLMDQARLTAGH
ncbi:MAG: pyridoxine 5'-phosphate synthase [Methylococcaceae bacterium]